MSISSIIKNYKDYNPLKTTNEIFKIYKIEIEDTRFNDTDLQELFIITMIKYSNSKFVDKLINNIEHIDNFCKNETECMTECSICLENINMGTQLKCGHQYHTDCIKHWYNWKNNCPLCTKEIIDRKHQPDEKTKWNIACNIANYSNSRVLDKWLSRYPTKYNIETVNINGWELPELEYNILQYAIDGSNIHNVILLCNKYNHNIWSNIEAININKIINIFLTYRKNYNKKLIKIIKNDITILTEYTIEPIIDKFIECDLITLLLHNNHIKKKYLYKILCKLFVNNKHNKMVELLHKYKLSNKQYAQIINNCCIFNNYPKQTISITTLTKLFNFLIKKKKISIILDILLLGNDYYYRESNILHYLAGTKKSYKLLTKIDKFIKPGWWYIEDQSDFIPLYDAIRYGSFETFRFLYNKYLNFKSDYILVVKEDITEKYVYTCSVDHSLLHCSILNNDIRIFKFLVKNVYAPLKLSNISNYWRLNDTIKNNTKNIYIIKEFDKYGLINRNNVSEFIYHLKINTKQSKIFINYLLDKYKYINLHNFNLSTNIFTSDYESRLPTNYNTKNNIFLQHNIFLLNKIVKYLPSNTEIPINFILKIVKNYCYTDVRFKKLVNQKLTIDWKILFNNLFLWEKNETPLICNHCKKSRRLCLLNFCKEIKLIESQYLPYDFYRDIDLVEVYYIMNGGIDFTKITSYYTKYFMKYEHFSNWINFYRVINKFIRTRYNTRVNNWKNKVSHVINEIDYYPNYIDNKIYKNLGKKFNKLINNNINTIPPSHIQPNDIIKIIHTNDLYITEKADGININPIPEDDIDTFYPKFMLDKELLFEAEFIEKDKIYIIFKIGNIDIEDYPLSIEELRESHPYIPKLNNNMFTPKNLEEYYNNDKNAYQTYIKSNKDTDSILWWVKPVWSIDLMSNLTYLTNLLKNDIHIPNIFPTDGWIITSITNNISYKIKPKNHLSADLLNIDGEWFTRERTLIKVNNDNNENGIWRCYWDAKQQIWSPREKRLDKHKPNSLDIVTNLEYQHKYQWTLEDVGQLTNFPYYHDKVNIRQVYNIGYNIKNYIKNKKILDLGCGYKSKMLANKYQVKKWVGLDLDLHIIENNKSQDDEKHDIYWLWGDFTKKWDFNSQKNNNLWINVMYNNWRNVHDIYDTIFIYNCIHYAAKSKNTWDTFINEINNVSKKGTNMIIRFLDRNLLEHVLKEKTLVNNNDFVKRIEVPEEYLNNNISNYWIKLYYSRIHTKPIIEPVVSKSELQMYFNKCGWKLIQENTNTPDNLSWQSYEKCFINCIFEKQI